MSGWIAETVNQTDVLLHAILPAPQGHHLVIRVHIDYAKANNSWIEYIVETPAGEWTADVIKELDSTELGRITGWDEEHHYREWSEIQEGLREQYAEDARAEDRNRVQDHW